MTTNDQAATLAAAVTILDLVAAAEAGDRYARSAVICLDYATDEEISPELCAYFQRTGMKRIEQWRERQSGASPCML